MVATTTKCCSRSIGAEPGIHNTTYIASLQLFLHGMVIQDVGLAELTGWYSRLVEYHPVGALGMWQCVRALDLSLSLSHTPNRRRRHLEPTHTHAFALSRTLFR